MTSLMVCGRRVFYTQDICTLNLFSFSVRGISWAAVWHEMISLAVDRCRPPGCTKGKKVGKVFYVVAAVVMTALMACVIAIDLALNGEWLSKVEFTWRKVFTTRHGLTLLWMNNRLYATLTILAFASVVAIGYSLKNKFFDKEEASYRHSSR